MDNWKDTLNNLRNSLEPAPEETHEQSPQNEEIVSPKQVGALTVVTDKKGRNGKIATIVEGFTIDSKEVETIARNIKQKLGVGGSVRDNEILVQGDHKKAVTDFLIKLNFKVKGV